MAELERDGSKVPEANKTDPDELSPERAVTRASIRRAFDDSGLSEFMLQQGRWLLLRRAETALLKELVLDCEPAPLGARLKDLVAEVREDMVTFWQGCFGWCGHVADAASSRDDLGGEASKIVPNDSGAPESSPQTESPPSLRDQLEHTRSILEKYEEELKAERARSKEAQERAEGAMQDRVDAEKALVERDSTLKKYFGEFWPNEPARELPGLARIRIHLLTEALEKARSARPADVDEPLPRH